MKAIWKILIGAAAVAAVTPYEVKRDEETGEVRIKAATWAGTYTKNGGDSNLTLKLLPGLRKDTACRCCDEECDSGDECHCETEDETDCITIEVDDGESEPKPEE